MISPACTDCCRVNKKKYVTVSFSLFLLNSLFCYTLFLFKLFFEGDAEISSPLLSQFHRMIVYPLLMIVLMLGSFTRISSEKNPLTNNGEDTTFCHSNPTQGDLRRWLKNMKATSD